MKIKTAFAKKQKTVVGLAVCALIVVSLIAAVRISVMETDTYNADTKADAHENKIEKQESFEKDSKERDETAVAKPESNIKSEKTEGSGKGKTSGKGEASGKGKTSDKEYSVNLPSANIQKPQTSIQDGQDNSTNDIPENEDAAKPENSKPAVHEHTVAEGNTGMWFDTYEETESYYRAEQRRWEEKFERGEITWDELMEKEPMHWEWRQCMCGKYTLSWWSEETEVN